MNLTHWSSPGPERQCIGEGNHLDSGVALAEAGVREMAQAEAQTYPVVKLKTPLELGSELEWKTKIWLQS